MTPAGLVALRSSATLAHSLSGVALRLRQGTDVLLDVCRPPVAPPGGRWLPPCAFRAAIGEAHRRAEAGGRFGCLGLPFGIDPAIDVGVAGTSVLHPAGIVGSDVAEERVLAFVTVLDDVRTRSVVSGRVPGLRPLAGGSRHLPDGDDPGRYPTRHLPGASGSSSTGHPHRHLPDGAHRVGVRHDPVTDVSLVYVVGSPAAPADADLELATRLAAACAAEELVDALEAGLLGPTSAAPPSEGPTAR